MVYFDDVNVTEDNMQKPAWRLHWCALKRPALAAKYVCLGGQAAQQIQVKQIIILNVVVMIPKVCFVLNKSLIKYNLLAKTI